MRILVGANVRSARRRIGMSQGALSEACGFSQQYLSELENGKRNPTVITLFEIAQALKVEVHSLLLRPAAIE
ncbi:helix-turn-helix domain-containing protein [Novosphingobium bradum]|uniref:Helix-turn-helix domain-containing protein n=1 Tax=Novosphingobium bradum TaxID=1737444 RepID=A0ABV7IP65_9SPHN